MRTGASEAEVMASCAEYLLYHHFMVMRINSGAFQPEDANGVRAYVRFYWWQILGDDRHDNGASDLLGFRPDMRICVECKRPGKQGNVSDAQKAFLAAWRGSGGISIVASSIDDLVQIVER